MFTIGETRPNCDATKQQDMVKGKSKKGSANKCEFNNVSSSPRRINESPAKKQVKRLQKKKKWMQ